MLVETLSQLVRKPSKVSEEDLTVTGWRTKQTKVLDYIENDPVLMKLIYEFRVANDKLKFIRSKKDIKIYFTTQEKRGEQYTYARCMFTVEGKPKEFRKYLGKAEDIKPERINVTELKKVFLMMLKNSLEYHK